MEMQKNPSDEIDIEAVLGALIDTFVEIGTAVWNMLNDAQKDVTPDVPDRPEQPVE